MYKMYMYVYMQQNHNFVQEVIEIWYLGRSVHGPPRYQI